jgi:SAM-dependent methyltransferase
MNTRLFTRLDKSFLNSDKEHIRRTRNIRLIPDFKNRRGGKLAYAEWAHVIGIFQTIMYQTLGKKTGNIILDIGCGTGLLGISAEPFVYGGGAYTGIDVMADDINFCLSHFHADNYRFIHFDVSNATYAHNQETQLKSWPVEDKSQDLVTALSVWTHLNETDAMFYMKEVARVLKDDGKAIITFFHLDQGYHDSLPKRSHEKGRFHNTNQTDWIFDQKAYASENWFTTRLATVPEDAIGVTPEGMDALLKHSGLKVKQYYPGNWKEQPGVFFQDVFVLEKE